MRSARPARRAAAAARRRSRTRAGPSGAKRRSGPCGSGRHGPLALSFRDARLVLPALSRAVGARARQLDRDPVLEHVRPDRPRRVDDPVPAAQLEDRVRTRAVALVELDRQWRGRPATTSRKTTSSAADATSTAASCASCPTARWGGTKPPAPTVASVSSPRSTTLLRTSTMSPDVERRAGVEDEVAVRVARARRTARSRCRATTSAAAARGCRPGGPRRGTAGCRCRSSRRGRAARTDRSSASSPGRRS